MNVAEFESAADKRKREEIEYFNEIARLRKLSYDAHIKAGFAHDDALSICAWHEE